MDYTRMNGGLVWGNCGKIKKWLQIFRIIWDHGMVVEDVQCHPSLPLGFDDTLRSPRFWDRSWWLKTVVFHSPKYWEIQNGWCSLANENQVPHSKFLSEWLRTWFLRASFWSCAKVSQQVLLNWTEHAAPLFSSKFSTRFNHCWGILWMVAKSCTTKRMVETLKKQWDVYHREINWWFGIS